MKKVLACQILLLISGLVIGKFQSFPVVITVLLSLSLVLSSYHMRKQFPNVYFKYIFRAIIFCFAGDLALMYTIPGGVLLGILFFGIAHIHFIIGYIKAAKEKKEKLSLRILPLSIIFYLSFVVVWFFSVKGSGSDIIFSIGSLIYGLLLSTMATSSLILYYNDRTYLFTLLGAILFLISDSLISLGQAYTVPHQEFFVKLTYYLALFGIIYYNSLSFREIS